MDHAADLLGRLDALRAELVDLAYLLECRGRRDAADLAVAVSARVGEIHDEFAARPPSPARALTSSARHILSEV